MDNEEIGEKISIAMAVYNGEKYLPEQLASILKQLGKNDEVVISYNESTDETWKIINAFKEKDERIKIFKCDVKGVIANFNNAIENTQGDIIFLSDQDDVWNTSKISRMKEIFNKENCILALHNCENIDGEGKKIPGDLFIRRNAKPGIMRNIIKNCYQGCCLAFKKELKAYICPIPSEVAMHDQWIGINAEIIGKVFFLDEKLIQYRRHELNVSGDRIKTGLKIRYIIKLLNLLARKYILTKKNDSKVR